MQAGAGHRPELTAASSQQLWAQKLLLGLPFGLSQKTCKCQIIRREKVLSSLPQVAQHLRRIKVANMVSQYKEPKVPKVSLNLNVKVNPEGQA